MSTILICGDSWGRGEWNVECTEILHPGLELYLRDDGHTVINLSKGACSNLDCIYRINLWFERFNDIKVDTIIIFQTEYTRDIKHAEDNDWNVNTLAELSSLWIARFYYRLQEIAEKHKCKIKIIGGCSDTDFFDDMENDHPGCEIVCQSLVSLIIEDNPRPEIPVFSWYAKDSEKVLQKIKKNITNTEELILAINQGLDREWALRANPEWFYPDGKHPNRHGHRKLYGFLLDNLLL